ncbi:hypothetical protein EUGRSUZ_A00522 [Eucalyptus grandis]|uniref:Uncharacterized protein n=2 Tax=Eucalyptus grandis TaxID=71139 RepID=A0ACC3M2P3_EUCGR|nr:hypothetical protein EUGRSUZ_A00522 [Eucalyptus grandis]
MAGSQSENSGCFSTLLRHLLCSNGAPTHPSDDAPVAEPSSQQTTDAGPVFIKDSPKRDPVKTHRPSQKPAGVVARLMGLDSLPDTKWVPGAKPPDAFLRSRSVNFMDYLLELDLDEADSNRHRRVRTSVSFREVPASLAEREKSEDLIVLYLGGEEDLGKNKKKKGESRGKRKQKTATAKKKKKTNEMEGEREEGKERKVSRLRDEPRRVKPSQRDRGGRHCAELKLKARKPLMAVNEEEALVADLEFANGGRRDKRPAIGGGETSSSPVSVLDQPPASRLREYKTNRHFSSLQLEHIILDPFVRDQTPCNQQIDRSPEVDRFIEEVIKVRKLAEEDVQSSKWFRVGELSSSLGSADLEELSVMLEHHVLDHLVEEVVRFLCRRRSSF